MKREIKISSPLANAVLVSRNGARRLAHLKSEDAEVKEGGHTYRLLACLRSGVRIYQEVA